MINSAAECISELMMGNSVMEVLEAIEFFKKAQQFNLGSADIGIKNMLLLINSKEPGLSEAVVNAYKVLYLESEKENKYEAASEVSNR